MLDFRKEWIHDKTPNNIKAFPTADEENPQRLKLYDNHTYRPTMSNIASKLLLLLGINSK